MDGDYNNLIADEGKAEDLDDDSGEAGMGGSATDLEADDDSGKALADVIGNEPEFGKPFSLANEVERDEMERRGMDPKDYGCDDE